MLAKAPQRKNALVQTGTEVDKKLADIKIMIIICKYDL
tara:strand:+ start:36 stop:149 length:114 start_codon:yes stop_codon:yes gene_type:complete